MQRVSHAFATKIKFQWETNLEHRNCGKTAQKPLLLPGHIS